MPKSKLSIEFAITEREPPRNRKDEHRVKFHKVLDEWFDRHYPTEPTVTEDVVMLELTLIKSRPYPRIIWRHTRTDNHD